MEESYPDIEILDEQSGEWLTENANTVMTDFLTKYPEIDAVLCHNDAMAEGAAEAAKAAGRDMQIWGVDGESKMLTMLSRDFAQVPYLQTAVHREVPAHSLQCMQLSLELQQAPYLKHQL